MNSTINLHQETQRGWGISAIVLFYCILILISPYYIQPIITLSSLIIFSIIALRHPYVILSVAIMVPPILGRPDEQLYYSFQSLDLINAWIFIFGTFYFLKKFKTATKLKFNLVLLALFILMILHIPLSSYFLISAKSALEFYSVLIIIPVCLASLEQTDAEKIFDLILMSAALPLLVGLYQLISGDLSMGSIEREATHRELEEGRLSLYSTFWYNHPYAKYLRLVIALPLAALVLPISNKRKLILGSFTLFILYELAMTYARSQLIGAIIVFSIIALSAGLVTSKTIIRYGPFLLVLFVLMYFATGLNERFEDLFQDIDLSTQTQENSLKMRFLIWSRGIPGIISSPIIGHGPSSFTEDFGIISHNDYLGLWYNLGIFGTLLYLAFFIVVFRALYKYRVQLRQSSYSWKLKSLYYATLGLTVAIAIESFVENILETAIMWRAFLIMAVVSFKTRDLLKVKD